MSLSLTTLRSKSEDVDKDIRYMCLNDLASELSKENVRLDDTMQRGVLDIVVKLLEDTSSDVQSQAVKCVLPLVRKLGQTHLDSMAERLSSMALKQAKNDKRDIAAIALKTLVNELPADLALAPMRKLTPDLLAAIDSPASDVQMEALDILNDSLRRFGAHLAPEHDKVQTALVHLLTSKRPPVRKRATLALASLAVHTTDSLFNALIDHVLSAIQSSAHGGESLRTHIQTLSAVSRTAGQRLGRSLPRIVPLLLSASSSLPSDSEDEVRENIVQAFESFVLRCPEESKPFVESIVTLCKEYLTFDPNYSYDEEEAEEEGDAMEEEEEEGEEQPAVVEEEEEDEEEEEGGDEDEDGEGGDQDFSDDEDLSWKVRKAATKCLTAVIYARPDMLPTLFRMLCSKEDSILIKCFREREESVKLDIFSTFSALLKQSTVISSAAAKTALTSVKKSIVNQIATQMGDYSSAKIRAASFSLLKELVSVLGGGLQQYLNSSSAVLITPIVRALTHDRSSNPTLKMEALSFLRSALTLHDPRIFIGSVTCKSTKRSLLVAVLHTVADRYYKITAEALRVCAEFVPVLASIRSVPITPSLTSKLQVSTRKLYASIAGRLEMQDIDQDVKDAAITAAGRLVSFLGDLLAPTDVTRMLSLLLDRMRNEITRLTATKTLAVLASSPLRIPLTHIFCDALTELSSFLRKNNRPLLQATLTTLSIIIASSSPAGSISPANYESILTEVSPLISDGDLHLAAMSLNMVSDILTQQGVAAASSAIVERVILPKALSLLLSPLLQGAALEAELRFFKALAASIGFAKLLTALLSTRTAATPSAAGSAPAAGSAAAVQATSTITKHSFANVAQCVAVICEFASSAADRDATVARFVQEALSDSSPDAVRVSALFCIGEIGRRVNLSSVLGDSAAESLQTGFESASEDVRSATSFALGNIAVGCLECYLPQLLASIKASTGNPKRQYLLLHSLKETIARTSAASLSGFVGAVLPLLFEFSEKEEEGVRNVVAECLGKLALVDARMVLPLLQSSALSGSELQKTTVTTALKFCIMEQAATGITGVDDVLRTVLPTFLALLNKAAYPALPAIRRAAVLVVSSAAHNKASALLPRDVLTTVVLPNLYAETAVDESLIRKVNLGPFTHEVDDGLELRKATFECMDTLLDTCLGSLDASQFVGAMMRGLRDRNQDIKQLAHLMAAKVARLAPSAVMLHLDAICEALKATSNTKVKEDAVQQEKERAEDLIRSAVRAALSISHIGSGASAAAGGGSFDLNASVKYRELMDNINKVAKLKDMMKELQKEEK